MIKNLDDDKSIKPGVRRRYINLLKKLSFGSWDQTKITEYVNSSNS